MKKTICMAVLAVTTFGSVYAAPVINGKKITAVNDTTKNKVKVKGDKKKVKMKGDSVKTKTKMKKDSVKTKM